MEIIGNGSAQADAVPEAPGASKPQPTGNKVLDALQAAAESVGASARDGEAAPPESPDDVVARAASGDAAKADPALSAAGSDPAGGGALEDAKAMLAGTQSGDVPVLRRHKDAFLDCVVSGERYTEEFSVFGGRVRVVIRSRTNAETDAVESYARRAVSTSPNMFQSEYASLMRRLLLVAQVAEVNGVAYPEMREPLKFTETAEGLAPPAWEGQLGVWSSKGDALVTALSSCVLEFEARYWRMVAMSRDENFWKPGESTGE